MTTAPAHRGFCPPHADAATLRCGLHVWPCGRPPPGGTVHATP